MSLSPRCGEVQPANHSVADVSGKKFRVPVLRAREYAIATAQAEMARIAARRLAALPPRWSRRSVVSSQRSAAVMLLSFFFDALLASFFNGFSGGLIGVVSGKSSVNTPPRPPGDFPTSNHRETAAFRSSIALHAARPMLVETATKTSATRAQARI